MTSRLIIFEIGSCYLRVGEANAPRHCTVRVRAPPLIGSLWHGGILGMSVGNARAAILERAGEELTLVLSAIWSRVLLARPTDCRVLVVEPFLTPTPVRAVLLAALLGNTSAGIGVISVGFVRAPIAAALVLAAAGVMPTALIVDIGAMGTRVVPVVHGAIVEYAAHESPAGARALISIAIDVVLRAARVARRENAKIPMMHNSITSRHRLQVPTIQVIPSLAEPLPVQSTSALGQGFASYGSPVTPARGALTDGVLSRLMWEAGEGGGGGAGIHESLQTILDPAMGGIGGALSFWVEGELERAGLEEEESGGEITLSLPTPLAHALGLILAPSNQREEKFSTALSTPLVIPRSLWLSLARGDVLITGNAVEVDDILETPPSSHCGRIAELERVASVAAVAAHTLLSRTTSLTDAVIEALATSPIDARAALVSHIVLVGGVVKSLNFYTRLCAAFALRVHDTPSLSGIKSLVPLLRRRLANNINSAANDPSIIAWEGAAALALSLSSSSSSTHPTITTTTRPDLLSRVSFTSSSCTSTAATTLPRNNNNNLQTSVAGIPTTNAAAPASRKRPQPVSAASLAGGGSSSTAAARLAALGVGLARARGVKK